MTDVDLTEFVKLSKPRKAPCKIGFALSQLGGNERESLIAALATDKSIIGAGAIVSWLEKRGFDSSTQAVMYHRGSRCTCSE